MGVNRMRWLWRKAGWLLGPIGLAGCDKTTDNYRGGVQNKDWPTYSYLADRSTVTEPLRQQAVNGAIGGATLYNYYFVLKSYDESTTGEVIQYAYPRPTAELTTWGKTLLNRLGRHATDQKLCVYIQTAVDTVNNPGSPAEMAKSQADLDNKRASAVRNYMAAVYPTLEVAVYTVDPDPVGMRGQEARNGYGKMNNAPIGFLSPSAVLGASIGFSSTLGTQSGGVGTDQGQTAPPAMPDTAPATGAVPGGLSPGLPE